LVALAAFLGAVFLAYEGCEAFTTPGKLFDRFREGDCYVTVFPNGEPGTWVTKVLGKIRDGAYIVFDLVPPNPREQAGGDWSESRSRSSIPPPRRPRARSERGTGGRAPPSLFR
jgi:hypothetical protein